MMDRTVVVSIVAALALMLAVLELVRRRRLREEYSMLWLLTAVAVVVLAGSRELLASLSALMGIHYPPSALMVIGFGFLTLTTLHYSSVVSRLSDENKTLAQEMAILRWQVGALERGSSKAGPAPRDSES
jgi:hypothetical protein